jgi:acetylornithine deacetylase/succinyl-diaminopimelate desuccinylase-like protein
VAAHGSRPHLGIDAILNAGPVLVAFGELNRQLAERPHPFLGPGNLHGSLIDGGTEESTIPDRCVFIVDVALCPARPSRWSKRMSTHCSMRAAPPTPPWPSPPRRPWLVSR